MDAETLLTAALPRSTGTAHHVLAGRALVRACMRQWDTALADAEEVHSLYSHTYMRRLHFNPSLSKFSHLSSATLQNVWLLSARGTHTRDVECATLRLCSSIQMTLPFCFSSRCISMQHPPAFVQLISRLRPLSCSWLASTAMQYHAYTTSSLSRPWIRRST